MISLSPPTICNSAVSKRSLIKARRVVSSSLTVTVTSKSISLCGFRPPSTAEPYKCTASNVGSRWRSMTPTTSDS
ncbi:hypothetical protein CSC00_5661 (plasmid) [Klebsiella pneumoniae]|nr:hypothetical protein CSC00_5661 [Klebsiella pneumoniae]